MAQHCASALSYTILSNAPTPLAVRTKKVLWEAGLLCAFVCGLMSSLAGETVFVIICSNAPKPLFVTAKKPLWGIRERLCKFRKIFQFSFQLGCCFRL